MTGPIKHNQMLIGKNKKPRCFNNLGGINLVNYVYLKSVDGLTNFFAWLDQ